jgi:hypothetical protein
LLDFILWRAGRLPLQALPSGLQAAEHIRLFLWNRLPELWDRLRAEIDASPVEIGASPAEIGASPVAAW